MEIDKKGLQIPHPRMLLRKFVLIPLLEINGKVKLPDGSNPRAVLDELGDDDKVDFYRKW